MPHLETTRLESLAATESFGRRLAGMLRAGDAVLLDGPLGAGKTALARAVLRAVCRDPAMDVPSPSYTLVQSYAAPGFTISHFDLWRLDGPEGLVELGWDEAREGVVLVEWPDRLGPLAPSEALTLELRPVSDDAEQRLITLRGWDHRRAAIRP